MRAVQQVKPQWGQELEAEYRNGSNATARRFQAHVHLYFPGLFRTHSFNIRGTYKEESVMNAYRFTDDFIMPRGYRPFPFEQIKAASVNYEIPVFYPDISLGSIAFIQRIRTNFFYDYGKGKLNNRELTMNSAGTEVFADLRLFRLFQMTMGARFNYLNKMEAPSPEATYFQFLITRFELFN